MSKLVENIDKLLYINKEISGFYIKDINSDGVWVVEVDYNHPITGGDLQNFIHFLKDYDIPNVHVLNNTFKLECQTLDENFGGCNIITNDLFIIRGNHYSPQNVINLNLKCNDFEINRIKKVNIKDSNIDCPILTLRNSYYTLENSTLNPKVLIWNNHDNVLTTTRIFVDNFKKCIYNTERDPICKNLNPWSMIKYEELKSVNEIVIENDDDMKSYIYQKKSSEFEIPNSNITIEDANWILFEVEYDDLSETIYNKLIEFYGDFK